MLTEVVINRWREVILAAWSEGKLDAMDEFYAPNYVRRSPPWPDMVGIDAYKSFIKESLVCCPDSHLTIDKQIYQGDWAASVGTWRGTFTTAGGLLPNVPATGQKLDFAWCSMVRWEGDKIVEERIIDDYLTMLVQAGVVKLG